MNKESVLLICSSPLQAFICQKVIEREKFEHVDLLYLTKTDEKRDRSYFKQLSRLVDDAVYLHIPLNRSVLWACWCFCLAIPFLAHP
jgi:hypothetical protein